MASYQPQGAASPTPGSHCKFVWNNDQQEWIQTESCDSGFDCASTPSGSPAGKDPLVFTSLCVPAGAAAPAAE